MRLQDTSVLIDDFLLKFGHNDKDQFVFNNMI